MLKDWTQRVDELNPDENPILCENCGTDENIIDDIENDYCQECYEIILSH